MFIFGAVIIGLGVAVVGFPLMWLGVPQPYNWIAGAVAGAGFLAWGMQKDPKRKWMEDNGRHVMAWLLPGWAHEMDKFYLVMVIYTFDESIDDVPAFLERVMGRIVELHETDRTSNEGEEEVVRLLNEIGSFELYDKRLQLPRSLTEGRVVYMIKSRARKHLLPDGEITLPFIYVAALPDHPNVPADMVAYPEGTPGFESEPSRSRF
jgi:hypothetical protein